MLRCKEVTADVVAVDKTLIEARGPLWHKSDRARNRIPKGLRGVDRDSTWGYSPYRGWVQGYSLELVVAAGVGGIPVPLLASADTASAPENLTFAEKVASLPRRTRYVVGDGRYDDEALAQALAEKQEGQRLVTPPTQWPGASTSIARLRRIIFYLEPQGQELYARRKVAVEPTFGRLKGLFEMGPAWMYGLANNRALLLAMVYCYQLLLYYNWRRRRRLNHVKHLLDGW